MDFNGIPLHPLVVHAVVVLTPVAALLAILYAVVPRWRWALRWPFLGVAVVGAAVTYLATVSGHDLQQRLGLHSALMEAHETWAYRLRLSMFVLAGAALVAAYVMPFRRPIGTGRPRASRVGVLRLPVALVLVAVGVVVLFFVYQTGDAGAHLVWDGTPR